MKKRNYLLILIAVASVIWGIVVDDNDLRKMMLANAFVCVGAVFDNMAYRVPFLIVGYCLL